MERNNEMKMLGMMRCPAFCVCDGRVSRINKEAASFHIEPGTGISELIATGAEEYAALEDGCLYLMLSVNECSIGASVTRLDGFDFFCLEGQADNLEMRFMGQISRSIRGPLGTIINTVSDLFPMCGPEDSPELVDKVSTLNKNLLQLLRTANNMSDAGQDPTSVAGIETVNITAVMDEIFEKITAMVAAANLTLTFRNIPEPLYCLADRKKLEKAITNIVTNSMKFSSPGDVIRASLTRRGRMLYLSVADNGSGIDEGVRGNIYSRFQRECCCEDSRFGIGLGMVLIRNAAAAHGGAVLIDQPEGVGTRVTISFPIRQGNAQVRSSLIPVESGIGWDPFLVAMSDVLPESLYRKEY